MTQAEKLKALLTRAVENAWNNTGIINPRFKWYDEDTQTVYWDYFPEDEYAMQLNDIIYDHDFARALFKHPEHGVAEETCLLHPGFRWRLQQAVVLPTVAEQIDYLYQAVFNDIV